MENYKELWKGRIDGDSPLVKRLHQKISFDTAIDEGDIILHGFAVDQGVKLNKGRIGAQNGAEAIRKNMANFPVVSSTLLIKDHGDVSLHEEGLKKTQEYLGEKVNRILQNGGKSLLLGGGHEVTYGHYLGIKQAYEGKRIGVINIDAHFDNREVNDEIGPTSGTGFYQIKTQDEVETLHIGIQRNSNTLQLFDTAHRLDMKYILSDELYYENLPTVFLAIDQLLENVDVLYLTICMDVFNASIAPGVSAQAYNGIFADHTFLTFYRHILRADKLVALDIAEVNPSLDVNDITARLAASLANEWLMLL